MDTSGIAEVRSPSRKAPTVTDEQIEKVAREIITIGVEACGVPRDFDPSQLENGIDALLGADDAESWRGIARWHIQQVEAAVRKEREAIAQMLENTACRPGTGAILLASATRIRQRGATTAENRDE